MDKDSIVFERFLKWLMFAVLVFCTGGTFFILYCAYHIFKGSQEVNAVKKKEVPEFMQDRVIKANNPENLSDEHKHLLSLNPDVYFIMANETAIVQEKDTNNVWVWINGKYIKFEKDVHVNPRYSYPYDESQWWNKDYKYKYDEYQRRMENYKEYINTL